MPDFVQKAADPEAQSPEAAPVLLMRLAGVRNALHEAIIDVEAALTNIRGPTPNSAGAVPATAEVATPPHFFGAAGAELRRIEAATRRLTASAAEIRTRFQMKAG